MAENCFKAGTIWTQYNIKGSAGPEFFIKYYSLLDEITVDNQQVLPFVTYTEETKENPELYLYLRTEGDRVLWRFTEPELTTWYVMYDFALEPGESIDVSAPHNEVGTVYTSNIKCLKTDISFENREGLWMELKESSSNESDIPDAEPSSTSWIIGIGSSYGPDHWNQLNWIGKNSWLINVTDAEGNVIYSSPAPSHSAVSEANDQEIGIKTEGEMIFVNGLNPGQTVEIYSLSGCRIESRKAEISTLGINLRSGIYVVKAGEKNFKISI